MCVFSFIFFFYLLLFFKFGIWWSGHWVTPQVVVDSWLGLNLFCCLFFL